MFAKAATEYYGITGKKFWLNISEKIAEWSIKFKDPSGGLKRGRLHQIIFTLGIMQKRSISSILFIVKPAREMAERG